MLLRLVVIGESWWKVEDRRGGQREDVKGERREPFELVFIQYI